MQVAIIAPNIPDSALLSYPPDQHVLIRHNESMQALALGIFFSNCPKLEPHIFCGADSVIRSGASNAGIPFTICGNKLVLYWKMWKWQKKIEQLPIIAFGQSGAELAHKLCAMRKAGTWWLNLVFPLAISSIKSKFLAGASNCICGSGYIAEKIQAIMEADKSAKNIPAISVSPPGIDIDAYKNAQESSMRGERFVFGMADSLAPDSGALLVVRAMSALWQQNLPPWEVRMFGSGPRFEEIMKEAASLGVLSRLSLLADQPLPEVSSRCHVWLAPGVSPIELPQILYAGFASCLPVIASASPLHLERASHAAIISDANNPQEMARSMVALIGNAGMYSVYGAKSAAMRGKISLTGMVKRIFSIINRDERFSC